MSVRGRTTSDGDVEFFEDADGTVLATIRGLGVVADIPATDPGDGVTIWNDEGVLKLASGP